MAENKKHIKVAFVSQLNRTGKNLGGADIHIINLLKSLSKHDELEIHVVTTSKSINKSKTTKDGKITYHILKSPKLPHTITGVLVDHRKIVKKVKEIKPDIVHAQILGAPYGFAAMKLCKNYPTILTVHTIVDMDAKNRTGTVKERIHDAIWRNLEKEEIKQIPNFIAMSNNVENELRIRGAKKVQVIPNGISDNWFQISNMEVDGRLLFVGRIMPIKSIENIIDALKIVKIKVPKAHLHIVGPTSDEKYKRKIMALIDKLELQDSVKFIGTKTGVQLEQEYAECSIFILPSKSESNPIVLLETMATSKTIIASKVGGIPEMITDGEEGFLVEYGNIDELAEKIEILITEKEKRKKMGSAGRERVSKLSWRLIAEKTTNYYKEILGDGL